MPGIQGLVDSLGLTKKKNGDACLLRPATNLNSLVFSFVKEQLEAWNRPVFCITSALLRVLARGKRTYPSRPSAGHCAIWKRLLLGMKVWLAVEFVMLPVVARDAGEIQSGPHTMDERNSARPYVPYSSRITAPTTSSCRSHALPMEFSKKTSDEVSLLRPS